MHIITYLLVGITSGLLSGMLGTGTAIIVIPALIWFLPQHGVTSGMAVHMAIGTSLAVVLVISIYNIWIQHKHQNIEWHFTQIIGPGCLIGALIGAALGVIIPGYVIKYLFVFVLIIVLYTLYLKKEPKTAQKASNMKLALTGSGISGIASLTGAGIGNLMVPYLYRQGIAFQKAIATSVACSLFYSTSALTIYMLAGVFQSHYMANPLLYINAPAFLAITGMSLIFTRLGVKLAQGIPPSTLKIIFSIYLVITSILILAK
ncbi:sulfite exporter TauE/SafE family protein [Legionella saoudiensis]|uniref:sulfite exporter TauE/SafE family protein n=1 Tax=Legionella saoudiensis TaxID=1750561 RepID=UPI0007311D56|nr:sulfite exporter TauE/SafE family protein [Legionella saoudiensis]